MGRFRGAVVGAVLLPLLMLPVAAQTTTATAPVYGRIVALEIPAPFLPASETESEGAYYIGFLPEGETSGDWTEMLTISGVEGGAATFGSAFDMLLAVGGAVMTKCPETFHADDLGAVGVAGGDEAHMALFTCPDLGGYSESTLIVAALSGADAFTAEWAAVGAPVVAEAAVDDPAWTGRADTLLGLRLCPVVAGEEPPYPSCLD